MIHESGTSAVAIRARAQPVARLRWWPDSQVWTKVRRERWMYAFILPGFVFFVVFRYLPLLGNVVAFQDYSPYLGFFDSPWVGLDNFAALLTNPAVGNALLNTLIINGLQILFYFPATIGLALLLNSLISVPMKRVVQSIVYLPYFIGWVVLVSVWASVLGGDGLLQPRPDEPRPADGQPDAQPGGLQAHDGARIHLEERRMGDDHLSRRNQQNRASPVRSGGS